MASEPNSPGQKVRQAARDVQTACQFAGAKPRSYITDFRAAVVEQVFAPCFDSCALPVAFVPAAFVLAHVSAAVVAFAVGVAAPCAVFGPDLPVPPPWRVLVPVAAATVGVLVPAAREAVPVLAADFCPGCC